MYNAYSQNNHVPAFIPNTLFFFHTLNIIIILPKEE